MVEVTIVVPVYNVEDYLKECLDSIINQTFKDIEIICINDGSTDGSLDILNEYAKNDSRIVLFSQKNSGVAASRNNGLKESNGKYVYFMDSDDILELTAIEELYGLSEDKSLDMVLFKLINFDDETKEKFTTDYYEMEFLKYLVNGKVFDYHDVGEKLFDMAVSPPGILFKRELIEDISFPEGLIFEDNPFFIECMFKSKRVYFYDKHLYNRRIRNNSITTSANIKFADTIAIFNLISDITKKYGHYDDFKLNILTKKLSQINYRYNVVDSNSKNEFFIKIQKDFYKNKVEYDLLIKDINFRVKQIYYQGLYSKDYREFEHNLKLFFSNYNLRKIRNKYENVAKYGTARLDIKNIGSEDNEVRITSGNKESYFRIIYEDWLCNDEGKGVMVQSDEGSMDLIIKTINPGQLKMNFRALNRLDKNNERFPIYIDYTSIIINDEDILRDNSFLAWHDEPFTYIKDVKDSEVVQVHVEWDAFTKSSIYHNKLKESRNKYKMLNKEYNQLKKENSNLNKELNTILSSTSWKLTKPIRKILDFLKK